MTAAARQRDAMGRFLTWANLVWRSILQNPSAFPGRNLSEKMALQLDDALDETVRAYVKFEHSMQHGVRWYLALVPAEVKIPTDFNIRLLFP